METESLSIGTDLIAILEKSLNEDYNPVID